MVQERSLLLTHGNVSISLTKMMVIFSLLGRHSHKLLLQNYFLLSVRAFKLVKMEFVSFDFNFGTQQQTQLTKLLPVPLKSGPVAQDTIGLSYAHQEV
jgi:hypothetical protein